MKLEIATAFIALVTSSLELPQTAAAQDHGLRGLTSAFCIRNESELRLAVEKAKPREKIVLCKNNKLVISRRPVDLDSKDIHFVCEDRGCVIAGDYTPRLFQGSPKYLSWDTIEFQNKIQLPYVSNHNGGCHKFVGGEIHFSNSKFTQCEAYGSGGAIAVTGSTLSIVKSLFERNKANVDGGAVYDGTGSKLMFIASDFQNNFAGNDGGGVFLNKSYASFTSGKLNKNEAKASGGAIYDEGLSKVFVADCYLTYNKAQTRFGGAIFLDRSVASITNSYLRYNTAYQQGGAVFDAGNSSLGAFASYFEYNKALTFDAGAINIGATFATFWDCKLNDNQAYRDGGAIDDDDKKLSTLALSDCKCNNNEAGRDGGCLEVDDVHAVVYDTTFLGNQAKNKGGAIAAKPVTRGYVEDSAFKNNHAAGQGNDLFVANDAKSFVKCDADTVFCNGAKGIFDQPRIDNTNCDKDASFASAVCNSY